MSVEAEQVPENRENLPSIISRWWPWFPHLLVVLWLLYLGIALWQHALHSVQPPIHDSLNYMQKAMNFWQSIENVQYNPLNIEPTTRPPGTILMSYPFGFSPDFQGFHFRSVFFPILCVAAAVYIVTGTAHNRASGWWVAAIALLFTSLPMFFHFDMIEGMGSPTRWGLVDNFQAGIAAMAAASILRSLEIRSRPWLLIGSLLASFTLLIKPSGLMVMVLLTVTWLMLVMLEWLRQSRLKYPDSKLRVYTIKGGALMLGVYACVSATCFFSRYLSSANFAYAKQALLIMRESIHIDFQQALSLFHKSSGGGLVLWVIGAVVLFVRVFLFAGSGRKLFLTRGAGLLAGSLLIWIIGAWYWLVVQAGGTEIRYFYPFMLMGAVYVIPVALDGWLHARKPIRVLLMTICTIPALNIGGLLAAGNVPAISWQKMAGVSISVGCNREEVRQAYDFLNVLRKTKDNVRIYSFSNGVSSTVFENIGMYEEMVRPKLPSFTTVRPLDWVRGFVVRVEELLDSDYILIKKYGHEYDRVLLAGKKFDSFDLETKAFEFWLTTLNDRSGVVTASEGLELRLLRVVDRRAFNEAIETFVSAHSWRSEFVAANQPMWWNAGTVSAHTPKLAAEEIDFSGKYTLHALSINRVGNGIKINVWWEELHQEDMNDQHFLFLHLIDSSGNILHNQQIALHPYNPIIKEQRWRRGEVIFPLQFPAVNVVKLAFGVYHVSGSYLLPDKGSTDWEGRRVLLPVSALTGAKSPPLLPALLN